jgi:hypothetical protein
LIKPYGPIYCTAGQKGLLIALWDEKAVLLYYRAKSLFYILHSGMKRLFYFTAG